MALTIYHFIIPVILRSTIFRTLVSVGLIPAGMGVLGRY